MYEHFIIPYLYEAQHVSGDTSLIFRSLKLHWQPLVFHTWKVVGRVVGRRCQARCAWQRPTTTRPTTFHVWKTRDCQCSFRLLMMGGVSPETCWALYKYGTIKILIHCCILLDFSLRILQEIYSFFSVCFFCRSLWHACCYWKTYFSYVRQGWISKEVPCYYQQRSCYTIDSKLDALRWHA